MIVDLNAEQQSFCESVREYMSTTMMTEDFVKELQIPKFAHGGGPVYWEKMRRLGKDGWIRLSWPKELGGNGADPVKQYILVDEAKRAGFPWPSLSANSIGPLLARYAQDVIADKVVNEILNGEAYLAIGYSEPEAGSDLASLKTRAQKEGDDWIINGQKIWTSCANFAQYIWLAARTDPDPKSRHKGITLFLVPTDCEGFSCTEIETLGVRTTATYYDNVRVPDCYRIGEINAGWPLMTNQLNIERLSLVNYGHLTKLYDQTCDLLSNNPVYQPLLDTPWVQQHLAFAHTRLEVLKTLCLKAAWKMEQGESGMVEASATKVYGSELYIELGRRMAEILGEAANVSQGSATLLKGLAELWYRKGTVHTFGGGANELQRSIVATAGLGLARA